MAFRATVLIAIHCEHFGDSIYNCSLVLLPFTSTDYFFILQMDPLGTFATLIFT